MIKRCMTIILAVVFIAAIASPVIARSEATKQSPYGEASHSQNLPTIELKDAKLRGTAISGIFKPIAIVEHPNGNFWYKEGDTLCGGRIVDIQRGAIVLEMNNQKYLFGLPEGEVGYIEVSSNKREDKKAVAGEKIGENIWRLDLNTAIELLTNVHTFMKEARIRPYFAVGKAAGIRIDRIKDDSVISQMGFSDGDIIKGVNGFGLSTPTRIFEAYRKYKASRLIEVQVLRNDEPVTLTYNIGG